MLASVTKLFFYQKLMEIKYFIMGKYFELFGIKQAPRLFKKYTKSIRQKL